MYKNTFGEARLVFHAKEADLSGDVLSCSLEQSNKPNVSSPSLTNINEAASQCIEGAASVLPPLSTTSVSPGKKPVMDLEAKRNISLNEAEKVGLTHDQVRQLFDDSSDAKEFTMNVLNWQINYNESIKGKVGFKKLKEDGVAGPFTLKAVQAFLTDKKENAPAAETLKSAKAGDILKNKDAVNANEYVGQFAPVKLVRIENDGRYVVDTVAGSRLFVTPDALDILSNDELPGDFITGQKLAEFGTNKYVMDLLKEQGFKWTFVDNNEKSADLYIYTGGLKYCTLDEKNNVVYSKMDRLAVDGKKIKLVYKNTLGVSAIELTDKDNNVERFVFSKTELNEVDDPKNFLRKGPPKNLEEVRRDDILIYSETLPVADGGYNAPVKYLYHTSRTDVFTVITVGGRVIGVPRDKLKVAEDPRDFDKRAKFSKYAAKKPLKFE